MSSTAEEEPRPVTRGDPSSTGHRGVFGNGDAQRQTQANSLHPQTQTNEAENTLKELLQRESLDTQPGVEEDESLRETKRPRLANDAAAAAGVRVCVCVRVAVCVSAMWMQHGSASHIVPAAPSPCNTHIHTHPYTQD